MRINHNISALNTFRQMGANQTAASKNMEKLSSGLKINRAGDDAAGLAISEKMRGQIRGLDMASKNAQDGISLIQTAEGALNETHSILQRMRELATQAANDTNTVEDRKEIQKEINQLTSEVNRIGNTTEFNTKKLLNANSVDADTVATVLSGLKEGGWLSGAEKLMKDAFGLSGSGTKSLYINLESNEPYGTLASVGPGSNGADYNLNIDLSDFAPGTGENGSNNLTGTNNDRNLGFYNDRIIAHEMVHVVMNDAFGNKNTNEMQGWFKEGSAELVHGGDERLKSDISSGGTLDANKLGNVLSHAKALLNGTAEWGKSANKDLDYSAGYVVMKFVTANVDSIKDVMKHIQDNRADTATTGAQKVENAITANLTGGRNAFSQLVTAFDGLSVTNTTTLSSALKINLDFGSAEDDTGSPLGSDYTGNVADAITAEEIVDNTAPVDPENPIAGFKVIWPESAAVSIVNLQVGANAGQSMSIELKDMRSKAISISGNAGEEVTSNDGKIKAYFTTIDANNGVTNGTDNDIKEYALDVSSHEKATAAIAIYDDAIQKVSSFRSELGAYQNRLEHTINNLGTSSENLTSAESRIRDVDMAKEMMEMTKNNILQQAAQAMLAQANQQPQGVLQLLR